MEDAERDVLDGAARVLAEGELDNATLRRIKEALLGVVPFDRIALHVEDPSAATFWVLWRDTASSSAPPAAFATGIHVLRDPRGEAPGTPGEVRVVEDVDPEGTPVDRALYRTNVRSYVVVPWTHRGVDVGWLTLAHHVRGAPSQAFLPLLLSLGRLLAPALLRAREKMRGRLFETLVDESPDGVLALDAAGTVIEANRAALRLLALPRGGVIARSVGDLLGAPMATALSSAWEVPEKALVLEDQGERPAIDAVFAQVEGVRDAAFRVHLRDATERRAAEEATAHVVALEAEKRQLVDNLPVIVARLDPKTGSTLFVNGAIERVLGYAAVEVQGHPGMDALLADPIEWEASAVARDRATRGRESAWQDRRYRHKDGRLLTLRESIYPVRDPSGNVRAIQVIAYDVTTEIDSRKQLMQADRLASLGALAGGIAHEINNPVAFIGLAAGHLAKMVLAADPAERERAKQLAEEIGEAAARIGNIVGELKLFTRIPEGALVTPVDVNRMVQMAVTLTSAELRRGARLEINLGELPLVPGEFSSLGQAFVNLLLNAAQAVLAKNDASPSSNFVRVSTFVEGGAIVVRVNDTGVGIEPRLLPRIFDPFFKTKASGDGAGLGLAITHNLVRRVGGDIRVTSEPGEGSTFDVVLPLEASSEAPARGPTVVSPRAGSGPLVSFPGGSSPTPSRAEPASRGRVLIVDDEQALAKALARQLAHRWDVDTVSTARDALAELSVHRYDVVACDLRMPDQSGPAIYEAIRARSPRQAARFIFTTGGSYGMSDDEIHARAAATGRPILEKPFDGATFESLVAEVAAQAD